MQRPTLSKRQIIKILSARERGSWEIHLSFSSLLEVRYLEPFKRLTIEQIMQAVKSTNRRMLEIVAHRMLIPGSSGQLITHQETRRMLRIAGHELIRNLSDEDQGRVEPLIESITDFLLNIVSVWYADSTFENEWEYVEAVSSLASAHMLDPVSYLRNVAGAQESITRWVYSPDGYRAHELASMDMILPERLGDQFVVCVRRCEDALHMAYAARTEERILRAMIPTTVRYWRVRAERRQRIEHDIRRIWPEMATDGPLEA